MSVCVCCCLLNDHFMRLPKSICGEFNVNRDCGENRWGRDLCLDVLMYHYQ